LQFIPAFGYRDEFNEISGLKPDRLAQSVLSLGLKCVDEGPD